ncbi:MAG: DNA polymerase I [Lachnospiraceae bacterium]|nr:DNA polymerase I [Lachnospiraceae bacterium]
MSKKLVLIDGHSILNRTFYGVPEQLTNAEGLHTNAIYGFLNILFKLLEEEKPDGLAVAFDLPAPTFRHEMFAEYKGTRKPMPEELRQQVPVMKQVLQAMGILVMEKAGLEADDILGTMAKRGEKEGYEVSLVSGDRDLLQIATEHIKIRIPKTKGGRTEIEDYYAEDVKARYQVTPAQFIELKALMGDTSDNVPGVPKIGEKTATGLMVEYGSIDNIYANLEQISKKSIKETLENNRDMAELSLKLVTICVDADLPFGPADTAIGELFTKEAYDWCLKLNFKNILGKFDQNKVAEKNERTFTAITDLPEAEALFEACKKAEHPAFSCFSREGKLYAVSICTDGEQLYCVFIKNLITKDQVVSRLKEIAKNCCGGEKKLLVFDVKKCYDWIPCDDTGAFFDCKLAAYLLNPNHKEYLLEDVGGEYGNVNCRDYKQWFAKKPLEDVAEETSKEFLEYACMQSLALYLSYEPLKNRLSEENMLSLYEKIEMPLTYVLYDMEKEGVLVEGDALKEYSVELGSKIEELESRIYEQVGENFNINSPKQLGEILFEKMGLKGGKKTKTGYSTAADVLEKLAADNPVVADILEYRGLAKLKSTYADGLTEFIDEGGRIHSSFNQMITATGRISSTEPNLQNIPMRTEMGRMIRKVFVAKEGCILADADYSQIELRILAHLSEDKGLIEAYHTDADIHRITASRVFHTPMDQVTSLQRRNAKAVNFGIVYGISAFGLSQDIGTSQKEAANYMEKYFATYPDVKRYQEETVAKAKETGYTLTMFDRRRPMPELSSSNYMQRQFGERAAMNAPIQGTAADIMKIAMIDVYNGLKNAGLKSKLILQVHDELLIETYEDEIEQVKEILYDKMKHAVSLSVPLEVDLNTGKNWYDAH